MIDRGQKVGGRSSRNCSKTLLNTSYWSHAKITDVGCHLVLHPFIGLGIEKQILLHAQGPVEFINRLADMMKDGMLESLRYHITLFRKERKRAGVKASKNYGVK
jgi:hypothetical protein